MSVDVLLAAGWLVAVAGAWRAGLVESSATIDTADGDNLLLRSFARRLAPIHLRRLKSVECQPVHTVRPPCVDDVSIVT